MGPPLNRPGIAGAPGPFLCRWPTAHRTRSAAIRTRNVLVFVQCGSGFRRGLPCRAAQLRRSPQLLPRERTSIRRPKSPSVQAGTKTTAIRRLMELRPDLLLRYQAVLFLDDDVEIERARHRRSLSRNDGRKARSCAASAHRGFGHRLSVPEKTIRGHGVTRVSSVEIMAPALTRRALETAKWVFAESVSGWGSDLLLGPAVRSAFGPNSVGRHRLGRRPARRARRPQGRRLLRLSAPLRRRSRARGQPDRGRLRRRTLSAAARAGRGRRDLPAPP